MRIGIDMLGEQSPSSRHRGIGRYVLNFVTRLLARDSRHEFVLYYYGGLEHTPIALGERSSMAWLDTEPADARLDRVVQELVDHNPHELDLYLVLSPLEVFRGWAMPRRGFKNLALGALCHDLIPLLYPDKYLPQAIELASFQRSLQTLRQYDLVLTNSEATKADCERVGALDPGRVVSINAGVDASFWRPADASKASADDERALAKLGIDGPFILNVSGIDWRKNLVGLIDAFALLPAPLRASRQLVLTMSLGHDQVEELHNHGRRRGIAERLVITGYQPDEVVRTLYQRCEAFVFPSHYEGFGFPIVEAMRCGAATIAGNNSSQVQLVGDAGLLCDTRDVTDIAARMRQVIENRELARDLRRHAPRVAAEFTWSATAELARNAFEALSAQRRRPVRLARGERRPRLAVFAALPPKASPAAQDAVPWIEALAGEYQVDVFHDGDHVPAQGARAGGQVAFHDYRLFPRYRSLLDYAGVLYRVADDADHGFVYRTLVEHPGIVALHDLSIVRLLDALSRRPGEANCFVQELAQSPVGLAHDLLQLHATGHREVLAHECAQRGLPLNRRIFENSQHVVLADSWTWARAQASYPTFADKTALISGGAAISLNHSDEREALRRCWDVAADALVVVALSDAAPGGRPLVIELIEAFTALAAEDPRAALLCGVGRQLAGACRERLAELGLSDCVRLIVEPTTAERQELIRLADVAAHLRRPPLVGEAMSTLTAFLAAGVPTIVNDSEGFSTLPDQVAYRVRWDAYFGVALRQALLELGRDAGQRRALSQAALQHTARFHDWGRIAGMYRELIDMARRKTTAQRSSTPRFRLHAVA